MSLLLALPIGIIYNLVIGKIGQIITKNYVLKDKIENNLIIEMIGGIIAFILAYLIFNRGKLANKTIKYGMIIGGSILLFYTLIANWDTIDEKTKLFALLLLLIIIMIYTYKKNKKDQSNNNQKIVKP